MERRWKGAGTEYHKKGAKEDCKKANGGKVLGMDGIRTEILNYKWEVTVDILMHVW